jgi:hypothetical protein
VGVADQQGLDPGGGGGGQQLAQVAGADHGGLIHDDECVGMQPQPAFAQIFERLCDRHAGVAGALANRNVDGLAGGGPHQHTAVVEVVCGGAQRAHRGGFARARWCGQRLDQPRRFGDIADGASLIGRQAGGVALLDAHDGAHIARLAHLKRADFFGQDPIQREPLVALALMSAPWPGQPHRHRVHRLFNERTR